MSEAATASAPAAEGAHAASAPSLLDQLQGLWKELPGLFNDRIELLSLELHRAGTVLVQVVVLIIVATILGVAAWLLLWAIIVMGLVFAGLPPALALGAAFLVNVAVAAWAVAHARKRLPLLRLPATRRHLRVGTPPTDAPPELSQPLAS
jgi:uncharacterized membrane protein YqjE